MRKWTKVAFGVVFIMLLGSLGLYYFYTDHSKGLPTYLEKTFVHAINGHDATAAAALFDNDAVFTDSLGNTHRGYTAILQALEGFVHSNTHISIVSPRFYQHGDVALLLTEFSLVMPGDSPVVVRGSSVLRQNAEGVWRYSIMVLL